MNLRGRDFVKLLDYKPEEIRYLIDLAQSFSRFYNEHHIICEDKETQNARLMLTKCVGNTIKTGLGLLGIKCPEKM